jgi:hypothetical protein
MQKKGEARKRKCVSGNQRQNGGTGVEREGAGFRGRKDKFSWSAY